MIDKKMKQQRNKIALLVMLVALSLNIGYLSRCIVFFLTG